MPSIVVRQPFRFAEGGNHVVTIEAGLQEVSERCALVAVEHLGVATLASKEKADDRPRRSKKAPAR